MASVKPSSVGGIGPVTPKAMNTTIMMSAALVIGRPVRAMPSLIARSSRPSIRTQEFGVRMALGARRSNVLAMVLRQGVALVVIGLALGVAGALALTRLMSTLLFGVQPTDVLTFTGVSVVLIAVAVIACFLPARRAASVDPIVALRSA